METSVNLDLWHEGEEIFELIDGGIPVYVGTLTEVISESDRLKGGDIIPSNEADILMSE